MDNIVLRPGGPGYIKKDSWAIQGKKTSKIHSSMSLFQVSQPALISFRDRLLHRHVKWNKLPFLQVVFSQCCITATEKQAMTFSKKSKFWDPVEVTVPYDILGGKNKDCLSRLWFSKQATHNNKMAIISWKKETIRIKRLGRACYLSIWEAG